MTGLVAVATGAGVVAMAYVAGARLHVLRPFRRIEDQMASLHREVVGCRATLEYDAAHLQRRLAALEATTATAANEVRMASNQLIARLPLDALPEDDRLHDDA